MNAREELIEAVGVNGIVCAKITLGDKYYGEVKEFNLHVGYKAHEFQYFLKSLGFSYDSGYGGQKLFGTVWLEGGQWLERGEYDGSEWWELKSYPEIPEELKS